MRQQFQRLFLSLLRLRLHEGIELSLKELNDNWEKQFLGKIFSKRLESRLIREHTERMLKEVDRRIFESVVVSVLDKKRRIKGIGLNVHNDLILDNFGLLLASLIRAPVADVTSVSLKDVDGVAKSFNSYSSAGATGQYTFNNALTVSCALGTQLQVGSGLTAPARDDYSIETPFATAPENGRFGSSSGSYAVGAISFSGSITAGGSGTVNETGFFGLWMDSGVQTVMLFHDLLATGVPFVAGQIILVSYSINL